MCGEKYFTIRDKVAKKGSPPRVRGKVSISACTSMGVGITPACAGKRLTRQQRHQRQGDHPRVCGEKLSEVPVDEVDMGSPPRVRGKGFCAVVIHRCIGITPACAGKREKWVEKIPQIWDHPRVCGEKTHTHTHTGSPPRVRGKDHLRSFSRSQTGITPACAGKRMPIYNGYPQV